MLDFGNHAMHRRATRNRQYAAKRHVLNHRELNRLAVLGALAVYRLTGPDLDQSALRNRDRPPRHRETRRWRSLRIIRALSVPRRRRSLAVSRGRSSLPVSRRRSSLPISRRWRALLPIAWLLRLVLGVSRVLLLILAAPVRRRSLVDALR